jgi:hypothetical protein
LEPSTTTETSIPKAASAQKAKLGTKKNARDTTNTAANTDSADLRIVIRAG